jgi:hypothetical protein
MISTVRGAAAKTCGVRDPEERDKRDCRTGNGIRPIVCKTGRDDAQDLFEFALPLEARHEQAEKAACAWLRLEQPLQHRLAVLQLGELFRKLVDFLKAIVAGVGANCW